MSNRNKTLLTLLITLLAFTGCLKDVPHNNPYDPANPDYGFAIRGKVQTYYSPRQGISGAQIKLENLQVGTLTGVDGEFAINGLMPDSYRVSFSADLFAPETLLIDLRDDTLVTVNLDALPRFQSIDLTTHHEWRHFPIGDHSFLKIRAMVDDPDGFADIATVYFNVHKFGTDSVIVQDTLASSINQKEFTALLDVAELNTENIQDLVGHEFVFHVVDDVGEKVASPNYFISRVLTDSLDINMHEIAADSIKFIWKPRLLHYHVAQYILLYQVNIGALSLFREVGPIDQNSKSTKIANDLPDGTYVWRVQHRDAFGNTNLSKEASFEISKTQ